MTDNITLRRAAEQALESLEGELPGWRTPAQERAITALRAALAETEPEQKPEPVAKAWAEGYRQGVQDERTSEASIGIAGFGAKVEPARQNPYAALFVPEPDAIARAVEAEREAILAYCEAVCKAQAAYGHPPCWMQLIGFIRARGSK
jgi:hypothetical protein